MRKISGPFVEYLFNILSNICSLEQNILSHNDITVQTSYLVTDA